MDIIRVVIGAFLIVYCMPLLHAAAHDEVVNLDHDLRVAAYYPPGYIKAGSKHLWPTLLFSHGFAGSALSQDELLHKIAESGILVLAVEHSDPVAFERMPPREGDSRLKILRYMRDHPFDETIYNYRPKEFVDFVRQVVNHFPVDRKKLIFAGHSMGGYTIINAVSLSEIKPVALITYSTGELNYKHGHPYFSTEQLAALKLPLFITYGEQEFDVDKGAYGEVIKQHYGGPVRAMMIKDGNHLSYNDPTRRWGREKRLEQINLVFEKTREFLQEILVTHDQAKLNHGLQ